MAANKNNVLKYEADPMNLLRGATLLSDCRMCVCIISMIRWEGEP